MKEVPTGFHPLFSSDVALFTGMAHTENSQSGYQTGASPLLYPLIVEKRFS